MSITDNCQMVMLQPQGRLDFNNSKVLESQFARLKLQHDALWIINLGLVDFMDSSGLVALIAGLKAARESGSRLVLCNVPDAIRLILELTQLDSVFEIFANYDAVLTTANAPALAA